MALERTVQISGMRGPYSVEQVTSFLPGKMYVEWDAKPADNWVLYITDQAAKTKLTVQIGKLTAEDIQQHKAGNYGAFETEVPLPASLCPTSNSTQLQVYITGSTRITSGSVTLPINYRSNTVSITLTIPNTNEFYPSLKTHEAYAEGYVRGENNQDYLLVGSSKFKSLAEYTPGSGADNGITYVEVYKGVHSDSGETEHRDNGTMEDYTAYETFRITDNPYTYEYQFNEPNTYAFRFAMFDSRVRRGDNTAYVSDIFRVWDYTRPSVTLTVQRSTTASIPSVVCKYKCSYSKLGDSNDGNLLRQLHIERKDLTDNKEWTAWRDISVNESGQITLPMGSTDNPAYTAHEWAFRGWVDDTIMVSKYPTESVRKTNSTMSQVSQIQSEFRVFNIHKDGKGLAVGKIATEADKLDVNLPTIFRKGISFDDCTTPAKFSKGVVIGNTSYIQTEPDTKTLNNLVYPLCLHNSENLFACNVVGGQYGRNSSQSKFGDTCLTIFGAEDNEKVVIKFKMGDTWIKPVVDKTHIYYTCLWAKQEQSNGYLDVYWEAGDNEPIISHMAVPTSGEWAKMSGRFDRQSEAIGDGAQYYRLEYHNGNVADKMWIDGVALYDLTAAFGAGKEPSKSWCDAHLDYTDESISVLDPNFSIRPELISEVPTTIRYTNMSDGPIVMRTQTSSAPMIKFQNLDADGSEQTLGYIGHSVAPNQKICRWSADGSEVYDLLDTGYVVDYIVEQGEAGKWKYEKWNSGKMECWGTFGTNSLKTSTQWGTLYTGTWMHSDTNKNARKYPVPFAEEPTVSATLTVPNGANGWLMTNFENNIGTLSTHAPAYQVVRTTDATIDNPRIHYHVVGKWKNN
ncbi:MAG: hypothetical protein KBT27_12035 [Prevotellaceae bacterium]|nr:hypothetical protein [Candidatus Faecinaster equi]